tara:strand:+ start:165 stop:605 length:441 start_codon:yes stop_codon:yes gene_type:complete
MRKRSLEYEKKFRKYLFSFNLETHKEICKNLNVKAETQEVGLFRLYCNKCDKCFKSHKEMNQNEWDEWIENGSFICSDCINDEMEEELKKEVGKCQKCKINENKNNKVNFVKRLLQRIDMGFGTMPLSEYQIQRIIEELFRHKIIQ